METIENPLVPEDSKAARGPLNTKMIIGGLCAMILTLIGIIIYQSNAKSENKELQKTQKNFLTLIDLSSGLVSREADARTKLANLVDDHMNCRGRAIDTFKSEGTDAENMKNNIVTAFNALDNAAAKLLESSMNCDNDFKTVSGREKDNFEQLRTDEAAFMKLGEGLSK